MRIVILALAMLQAGTAAAVTRTYVIAIGNNAPPPGAPLAALRFADDDAAAFYQFALELADGATLLSVLDADSQRRYPRAAAAARAPSLSELRDVVADYRARFAADRARGDEPVLLFFYSGHGQRDPVAALTFVDGPLTRAGLYDVLAALPARYIHLLIDACHAEAVVRPRDGSAEVVDVTAAEVQRLADEDTLARFPNVGALMATSADQQAHEWDVWQNGVFTHEVLSGLRGAADINGDGRIEYSELHAFLAAANHDVRDARARLQVVVRVPPVNLRVAIVELGRRPSSSRLTIADGPFSIENERGERLADAHLERGHEARLTLPAGERLFFRASGGETTVTLGAGERARIDRRQLRPASLVARGALGAALERGLFSVPFGPAYYRGFVDRVAELPVDAVSATAPVRVAGSARRQASFVLFAGAAGLGVAAAVTGGLALDARSTYLTTTLQRTADDARRQYGIERTAAFVTATVGAVALMVALAIRPSHHHSDAYVAVAPLSGGAALTVAGVLPW